MGFRSDCVYRMQRPSVIVLLFSLYSFMSISVSATVILIGENITLTYNDIAANFAPRIQSAGICGKLYAAEPIDACSSLTNEVDPSGNYTSPFALIVRGGCSFEEKVRRAQKAGFRVAIVYDNKKDGSLIAMAGNSAGINIHAVFVSKASGEELKKYGGKDNMELWLIPSSENSAWSIMAISFISLLAMSAVLATCFFVRRHRIRRDGPRDRVREFHGMSSRLVKAMPSLIFTAVLDDNCTSSTCAICLDDYSVGDKLRILPCRHKFHAICVDSWLTSWRTFCPVCKRDARTSTGEPPASECTPLLSSSPATSVLSSARSSFRSTSSSIQIAPPFSLFHHASRNHSFASSPQIPHSLRSYHHSPSITIGQPYQHSPSITIGQHSYHHQSPSMSVSESYRDLRNMSSLRSHASHLMSPHSMGYPSSSPLNARFMYPYISSPSHASSSYRGSSSRYPNPSPLHHSESAASFSSYTSGQSLPGS